MHEQSVSPPILQGIVCMQIRLDYGRTTEGALALMSRSMPGVLARVVAFVVCYILTHGSWQVVRRFPSRLQGMDVEMVGVGGWP